MVKKYQQKFREVKENMGRWDELQSLLLSQFRNTSSIIERLQVIQDSNKYGSLKIVDGIKDDVLAKQLDSLQTILLSMNKTVYLLKLSVVSALSTITLKRSASDLEALQQLLFVQPNIPKEEVQFIYDITFAEEIC